MRNIFLFCGICGYLFIPIKMVWPAWRLYDLFMAVLVYYTWRYAWGAKDLKVVYNELGRTTQLADELEKSRQESRGKTFFLNAISHDLKTPLNGLVLQSHVAEMGMKTGDHAVVTEAIAEMRRGADATAQLLDSLLDYARLNWSEAPNCETETHLSEIVQETVQAQRAAATSKGLSLQSNVPPDLRLRTDRAKLERVLTNLLVNAVKFTERGSIRVEARRVGPGVEIHVIDTGVGIAKEAIPRLFDEFFQLHNHERDPRKGFGLGLAIARHLTHQLGGELTVDSAVGAGSKFTIMLPDCTVGCERNTEHTMPMANARQSAVVTG
jgi:signal transduction histidine kinase